MNPKKGQLNGCTFFKCSPEIWSTRLVQCYTSLKGWFLKEISSEFGNDVQGHAMATLSQFKSAEISMLWRKVIQVQGLVTWEFPLTSVWLGVESMEEIAMVLTQPQQTSILWLHCHIIIKGSVFPSVNFFCPGHHLSKHRDPQQVAKVFGCLTKFDLAMFGSLGASSDFFRETCLAGFNGVILGVLLLDPGDLEIYGPVGVCCDYSWNSSDFVVALHMFCGSL